MVARLLGPDLAARDLLAALLEARVDARLLGGALAQLGGELLAGRAVGGELGLERLDAGRDAPRARASQRGASRSATGLSASSRASRRRSCSSRRARSARSRSARSASRCSVAIARLDLRAALGARALVGRGAALLDDPAGVALGLGGLVARARGGARLAVDRVARASASATSACAASTSRQRGPLGLGGRLDLLDQRVAAVALGEHPVVAAGRDLPQLARGGRPDAAVLVTATPVKAGSSAVDVLDDPDVGEDDRREAPRGVVAGGRDVGGERLGAVTRG